MVESVSKWMVLRSFAGNGRSGVEGEELDEEFRNLPEVKDWRRAGFLPRLKSTRKLKKEAADYQGKRTNKGQGDK